MIRTLTAVALQVGFVGQLNALDKATLDACEQKLGVLYEACKKNNWPAECNRAFTTRLCGFSWSEGYEEFQDRRIEESAAFGLPYVFAGLKKLKPTYTVAGGK